jgi:Ran GTPase-activating protein (RanGAP) involved in mRNA processing and transport
MHEDATPVRCPAPTPDDAGTDRPLIPLLDRLADPEPVPAALTFPLGTLQPDGRLDLCKQGLGPQGVRAVLPGVFASPHARHLLLGTNGLGNDGAAAVAGLLTEGHHVQTLYLGCNHIDAEGVRPLAAKVAADTTVRALWLKRNPIGDEGARAVAEALAANTTLRTLDLTNTGLTADGLRVLVDALLSRPVPVERLYLGGNGLGDGAAPLLTALLGAGVRELYLACGRLGDDGARALADALPRRRNTVVLGLGGNGIGPVGVRALAARLGALAALDLARPPSSRALRALDNTVGDVGAAALADALPGSGLRRLDLHHTGITGRGAKLLLDAVAESELEELGLGSGIPRRVKRAVRERLRPMHAPPEDVRAIVSVYR